MEVKPGYKQSEAGVIPQDWTESTVGNEFEVQLGKMVDAAKNYGVPKPYLGNAGVKWGRFDLSQLQMVPMSKNDMDRYRLLAGDLLVCEGRGVGRSAIWTNELSECYYQKALHRLRARRGFSPRLMVEIFRFWVDQERLTHYVTESTIPHLTKEKLVQIPLAIPNATEQENIVQALSDVNTLIESLDRLITKKRDVKHATMQQLLTGKTRLPSFSGEWATRPLGELADVTMGQSPDSRFYNRRGDGLPLIQGNADIENYRTVARVWTTQSSKRCQSGDLILTVRAPVGAVGVASEAACLGRGVCGLQPTECHPFLFHALVFAETRWKSLEQGSTFTSANSTQVEQFEVQIPVSVEEQAAIAEVLRDMDAEIAALEDRRDKTRLLKEGMAQELLTGRTRLV